MNNNQKNLLDQIEKALGQVNFGSVEIIVQDKKVTQISVRSIQKTSIELAQTQEVDTNENTNSQFVSVHAHFRRSTD